MSIPCGPYFARSPCKETISSGGEGGERERESGRGRGASGRAGEGGSERMRGVLGQHGKDSPLLDHFEDLVGDACEVRQVDHSVPHAEVVAVADAVRSVLRPQVSECAKDRNAAKTSVGKVLICRARESEGQQGCHDGGEEDGELEGMEAG
eukprot:768695-Hanusia_phi.AAC.1